MQLVKILLFMVSALTLLSGTITFFGSPKENRTRWAWYFVAAIFATAWMLSIAMFFTAKTGAIDVIDLYASWSFISVIFLDAAFLGYAVWDRKYGKAITLAFWVFGLIIGGNILLNPDSLYSSIIISNTGNSITFNVGPIYFMYIAFFAAIVPVIVAAFFRRAASVRNKHKKTAFIIIMSSFGISSNLVLVFSLILPLLNNWAFVWIGPLALATTILSVYYAILRYRMLSLSSIWIRLLSYVVIISSISIVYMVIFAIIFSAIFRGSTPSTEVIVLNFIMTLILISLLPALNKLTAFIGSVIKEQHPDKKKEQE